MDSNGYKVKTFFDVNHWRFSKGYQMVLNFVEALNKSVTGQKTPPIDEPSTSQSCNELGRLLNSIQVPMIKTNQSFQEFQDIIKTEFLLWSENKNLQFVDELLDYFQRAFGSNEQSSLEFGPGNELSFMIFLASLDRLDFMAKEDYPEVALKLFPRYITICRSIIKIFDMKASNMFSDKLPEEHFVIPYLWGSAQLCGRGVSQMIPDDYLDRAKVEKSRDNSLFLDALADLYEQNPRPLEQYSPMLYHISFVPKWSKVNSGFMKLFEAEVMRSYPIARQLRFGNLLSFDRTDDAPPLPVIRNSTGSQEPPSL